MRTPAAVVLSVLLAGRPAGGAGAHERPGNWWTAGQAKSITSIRGTPVQVERCEARGPRRVSDRVARYRHFACVGSTKFRYHPVPTVAVNYVLHPLGKYVGKASAYVATDVSFVGLGVP
jgi:hypothetical protein